MIRNVVWDMGGVLADFSIRDIIAGIPIQDQNRALLQQEIFTAPEWILFDAGAITPEEFIAKVQKRVPEEAKEDVATALTHWYEYTLNPIPETLPLVQRLKAAGIPQYVLSNANVMIDGYKDRITAFSYMDGLFFSAFYKLMKPERRIYERFTEEFGLKIGECVFIDDSHVNIAGAWMSGMEGILYRGDPVKLEQELKARGLVF